MAISVEGGVVNDCLDAELFAQLAADLIHIAKHGHPPPGSLDGAPMLDHWTRTLTPHVALIGNPPGPIGRSTTSTVYAIPEDGSWARTLGGWFRLGRHVDEAGLQHG